MKNDEVLLDNVIGTRINTIPLYTYGNMGKRSEVLGMVVVDGNVYACGYYEDIFRYGCVWVNGELYACYPHNAVRAIDCCEGGIYYAVGDLTSTIYKSGYELYELYTYDGKTNWVYDLKAFGGDVYSVGFVGYNDCFVWKNADYLYIHAFGREANFNACYFDGHSLYYVGWNHEDHGIIFKDGELICSKDFCCFYDVFVKSDPFAVEERQKEKFAIYPNPSQEFISYEGVGDGEVIDVFNVAGQLVRSLKADSGRKIDVRDLPSGFYMVRCGQQVMRFIKE